MLLSTLILAMLTPTWAGKCKVDWTRSEPEARGRSVFDHQGRPLQVSATTPAGKVKVRIAWGEHGPVGLDEPGREAGARWEGDHPVSLWVEEGETRIEDRWSWGGGVVGAWSRCRWEGGEPQPCLDSTYAYDPQARLVRISAPQGSHLLRWEVERLVEHTWPMSGAVHRLTWDGAGRLESRSEDAGGVEVVERYTRDERGRVVRREVHAGEALLEATVAEYDRSRLLRVGREGADPATLLTLTWNDRDRPVSMVAGEVTTTWSWRGACDATVRGMVRRLGLAEALPLPTYLAPWLSDDLDLALPWVPGELPAAEGPG